MEYAFEPLHINYIKRIATWRMGIKGAFVDMEAYFDSYSQGDTILKGPGNCLGFAVLKDNKLIGLFEYYERDDDFEIGLALAPKERGKGYGKTFVEEGIAYGAGLFKNAKDVYLEVSIFNRRAIKVYRRIGFVEIGRAHRSIQMKRAILLDKAFNTIKHK